MGRPFGVKRKMPQYNVQYLDVSRDIPKWDIYQCASYDEIIDILNDKYNVKFTRDILQNIVLCRYCKLNRYPNLKIERIKKEQHNNI